MRLRNYAPRLYQAFSTEGITLLSCGVPVSCLRVRVSCFKGLGQRFAHRVAPVQRWMAGGAFGL